MLVRTSTPPIFTFHLLLIKLFKFLKILKLACELLRTLVFKFQFSFKAESFLPNLFPIIPFLSKASKLLVFLSFQQIAYPFSTFLFVPSIFIHIPVYKIQRLKVIFQIIPTPKFFFSESLPFVFKVQAFSHTDYKLPFLLQVFTIFLNRLFLFHFEIFRLPFFKFQQVMRVLLCFQFLKAIANHQDL